MATCERRSTMTLSIVQWHIFSIYNLTDFDTNDIGLMTYHVMAKTRLQRHKALCQAAAAWNSCLYFFPNDNSKRLCVLPGIGASYYDMKSTIVVCYLILEQGLELSIQSSCQHNWVCAFLLAVGTEKLTLNSLTTKRTSHDLIGVPYIKSKSRHCNSCLTLLRKQY